MNNIEKFKALKEINRLKGEYHKRELIDLVTFEKPNKAVSNNVFGWIAAGKTGFDLFRQIKSLIQQSN